MQNKEKNSIDTRTFVEIWSALSPAEQSDLRYEIQKATDCSRQSIHNWSKGVSPISQPMRRKVAVCMGKVLGLNVSHITLFPLK